LDFGERSFALILKWKIRYFEKDCWLNHCWLFYKWYQMTLYKLKHGILVIKVVAVRSNGIYCTYKIIIELFQIIQWRCMHLQQNWLAERDEDIIFCEWLVSFELLLYFRWFLYICCNFWIKLSLWVNWFENKFSSKTLHILNLLLFWKTFRKS